MWAFSVKGDHVATMVMRQDVGIQFQIFSTQKFTFANTNTEVTPDVDNMDIDFEIIFLDLEGGRETKVKIKDNSTMHSLCSEYAKKECRSLKSLRFTYKGRPLFLSSVGKDLMTRFGLINKDVLIVSCSASITDEAGVSNLTKKKNQNKNFGKKGKKNKGNGGGKNRSKSGPRPVIKVMATDKEKHSKEFSLVLREAEPILKDIRQKLNELTLERTQPKQKGISKKNANRAQDPPICNPPVENEGNKVIKPYYLVHVGEVRNLYKSAKGISQQKQRTRSLDLQGLKSHEAVARLNEHLTQWVDIAMRGEYPFVIPIALVCGGGNRVLSDTVENWIGSKREVAKAPKSYFG
ncbi:hypothetical protein ACHAWF_011217 [Thalassiosira exigua]